MISQPPWTPPRMDPERSFLSWTWLVTYDVISQWFDWKQIFLRHTRGRCIETTEIMNFKMLLLWWHNYIRGKRYIIIVSSVLLTRQLPKRWGLYNHVYFVFACSSPFRSKNAVATYAKILEGIISVDFPITISDAAESMVRRLCRWAHIVVFQQVWQERSPNLPAFSYGWRMMMDYWTNLWLKNLCYFVFFTCLLCVTLFKAFGALPMLVVIVRIEFVSIHRKETIIDRSKILTSLYL